MLLIPVSDGFDLPALHVPATRGAGRPLLLIQEIFGINAAMRQAAADWAALGFDVLCPDLFARQQPGVALDPRIPGQRGSGLALMSGMDPASTLRDLEASRRWLADRAPGQDVAALGYCLGGRLAVEMALSTPISAVVSYYGVGLEHLLPRSPTPIAPTLLHVAENDAYLSDTTLAELLSRAGRLSGVTAHVYPGCRHAFARPGGENYDDAAARLARRRTLDFLGGR